MRRNAIGKDGKDGKDGKSARNAIAGKDAPACLRLTPGQI